METHNCPDCGAPMVKKSGQRGDFLGCTRYPNCIGATRLDGREFGGPDARAKKAVRLARMKAHDVFDRLWKGDPPRMNRGRAYRVMQILMQLPPEKAHILKFDKSECERLIEKLNCEAAVEAAIQQADSEPKSDRKREKAKRYWQKRKQRQKKNKKARI